MDINKIIINEKLLIREAMKKIDSCGKKILMVIENNILKGVITDGDIRRWILKNGDLDTSVKNIINYNPIYITKKEKKNAYKIMKKNLIEALPIVNLDGSLKSVIFWSDLELDMEDVQQKQIDIPVVIMAGGKGTRLYPYTKILPKPLIPIGDTPIVERIINNFVSFGCKNYYLTVNHKKNMIKSYFNDLEKNYKIDYVEEEKPLGTGGSLYLLSEKIESTFFISNCDILVNADYIDMYEYHKKCKNLITVVCVVKNMLIPYGVISLGDDGAIEQINEKPEYTFLTNTGMYIVEPEVLAIIPKNEFYDFPKAIEYFKNHGENVGVYPITESCWMDMGQIDEMNKMINKIDGDK